MWLGARLGSERFCRVDFEELLLILGGIYTGLRAAEASSVGPAFLRGGAPGKAEFRRNVTKYWIQASTCAAPPWTIGGSTQPRPRLASRFQLPPPGR